MSTCCVPGSPPAVEDTLGASETPSLPVLGRDGRSGQAGDGHVPGQPRGGARGPCEARLGSPRKVRTECLPEEVISKLRVNSSEGARRRAGQRDRDRRQSPQQEGKNQTRIRRASARSLWLVCREREGGRQGVGRGRSGAPSDKDRGRGPAKAAEVRRRAGRSPGWVQLC